MTREPIKQPSLTTSIYGCHFKKVAEFGSLTFLTVAECAEVTLLTVAERISVTLLTYQNVSKCGSVTLLTVAEFVCLFTNSSTMCFIHLNNSSRM
jgi:hypothetical protein